MRPYFAYCTNLVLKRDRFFLFFTIKLQKTLSTFLLFSYLNMSMNFVMLKDLPFRH